MTNGPPARLSPTSLLLVGIALAAGTLNASRFVGAVCDDAVISFRSVLHWELGHGLVYNVGERLETFTNLGLVWLLVLLRTCGVEMFAAATAIGVVSAVAVVAATWWLSRELQLGQAAALPALFVAGSTTLMGQAGSGLETTLCALLVTAGTARALAESRPSLDGRPRRQGVAALVLALAMLVRPDCAVALAVVVALKSTLREGSQRWRPLATDVAVAGVAVGTPAAFRWLYYGSLVPNPVLAKAGHGPDVEVYEQGLGYLLEWLQVDFGPGVFAAGLVLALFAGRPARLLAALAILWCGYVIASGGDHMPYARFLAPVLPAMAVAIAAGMQPLFVRGGRAGATAGVLLALAVTATPVWLSISRGNLPQRNQEHESYRREIGELFAQEAARQNRLVTVAVSAVGYIGYFGGERVRVVDMLGLCNATIARHGRRDTRLPPGHQIGDGAHVLAQRPDVILLGTTTPGDRWQAGDATALLAAVQARGAASWAAANDHRFMVSERELLDSPALAADYAFERAHLPSGRTVQFLRRRA